jgi:preprotein translocase subunit SecA
MNRQRTVIYEERRRVLEGEDLHEQVEHMINDTIEAYVRGATGEAYAEEWDLEALWTALKQLYPVSRSIDELAEEAGGEEALSPDFLVVELQADAQVAYEQREESIGSEAMRELERRVVLSVLDRKWREHLYEMDYLKEGIGLRAMAQRDPLVEYQREGFDLFNAMMEGIKEESVGFLFNLDVQVQGQEAAEESDELVVSGAPPGGTVDDLRAWVAAARPVRSAAQEAARSESVAVGSVAAATRTAAKPTVTAKGLGPKQPTKLQYSAPTVDGETTVTSGDGRSKGGSARDVSGTRRTSDDPYASAARNGPCPCGSGKKYKRCHGDPRNRE